MSKVFITGEIGINHNGDLDIAKQLINMAIRCGCDAVKFQKRTIEACYTKEFLDSPRESPWGTTQREQKYGLEFGKDEYDEIDRYCKAQGIEWYASAWDIDSQIFLMDYGLKYNKVASKMLTHFHLLELIAREGKHTFISIGNGHRPRMIEKAIGKFDKYNCPYTIMHCVPLYPCPIEKCNLGIIPDMIQTYGEVGYSSHFPGASIDTTIAVALGATAIEKHITLDRSMYGSDQSSSLEERGLYQMVRDARSVEAIL